MLRRFLFTWNIHASRCPWRIEARERSRLREPQPLNLFDVMTPVNEMELPSLVDRQRIEDGMIENFGLRTKLALACREDRVHLGDFCSDLGLHFLPVEDLSGEPLPGLPSPRAGKQNRANQHTASLLPRWSCHFRFALRARAENPSWFPCRSSKGVRGFPPRGTCPVDARSSAAP